jgi:EAL and modified HD-GYP domain-containing signal transduction protein
MTKGQSMSGLSFLNGFFGGKKEGAWYDPPKVAPAARPAPQPASAPHEEIRPEAILLREEIIDSRNRLCGYRLTPKALANHRPYPEPLFLEALREERITEFAQRRKAVIPISPDTMIFNRHLPLQAPHTHLLMDLHHATLSREEMASRLGALRDGGFHTAIAGATMSAADTPLLRVADMAFIDLSEYLLPNLQNVVRDLRAHFPKLALAAEGVHSWAEQRMCIAWGFEYCLGDFLNTRDTDEEEGKLSESHLASIEMLNLLRRDAELTELVEMAKRDPGLAFHLLKWANSPATGLATTVTSINQAIMVLGRAQLYRWLMVAMFRMGKKHERDESLLEMALTRARCLETMAAPGLVPAEREELFLVGLLSLFDVLLNMSMPRVLSQMHLSDKVADVLLRSEGPYGRYLMLVLAMEKGRVNQATQLAERLGIPLDSLEPTRCAAFGWAQQALNGALPQ